MKCKNCEGKYYKGDEPSPKGRGYSASAERIGKRMKGKDGKMWEVVEVKNGNRWMRVSLDKKRKTSPRMNYGDDDFYNNFWNVIKEKCPGFNHEDVHDDGKKTFKKNI